MRSRSPTSISTTGATSCRGSGARCTAPAGVAIDDRPELWVHAGGRACWSSSASGSASGTCSTASSRSASTSRRAVRRPPGSSVTPIRLPHYTLETYGFRLSVDGKTIAYSGDSGPSERLVELAPRHGPLRLRGDARPRRRRRPAAGHLSVDEALRGGRRRGHACVLLTHRPAELTVPAGIERAYDGLELEL